MSQPQIQRNLSLNSTPFYHPQRETQGIIFVLGVWIWEGNLHIRGCPEKNNQNGKGVLKLCCKNDGLKELWVESGERENLGNQWQRLLNMEITIMWESLGIQS